MKYTEQQMCDLEDKIYVLLGQLGDGNPEVGNDRNEQSVKHFLFQITEEANRFAGQANYLSNFVVRTPYENEIDILTEIPVVKGMKQWEPTMKKFKEQCEMLFKKLSL